MGSFFVYQHYSVTPILQVVTPISILKNVILGSSLQYRSSKITPSLFVDKASCTRQFENEFSLHSLASLFPIKKGFFSTSPSLLQGELHLSHQASLPSGTRGCSWLCYSAARVLVSSAEPVPTRGCR